jgi:hypothetical protein
LQLQDKKGRSVANAPKQEGSNQTRTAKPTAVAEAGTKVVI